MGNIELLGALSQSMPPSNKASQLSRLCVASIEKKIHKANLTD